MEDNKTNIIKKIVNHAQQGKRKYSSLRSIYGNWGALKMVMKNILFIEQICRLDKDLSVEELAVEPKKPMVIQVFDDKTDLSAWPGLEELLQIRGEYGVEQFATRFSRGDLCFAAYADNEIVGFVWIEFPPCFESGWPLKDGEAFTYDAWTFDKHRGLRSFPFIQQAIMNYVRENRPDIHNLVTHVASWNKASLSGDQRAGYIITRLELTVVILGFHRKIVLKKQIPQDLIMHQR